MAELAAIPVEMRTELVAGVEFIKTLVNRLHKLDPVMVEVYGETLAEILYHKYIGHWYPEKPMKGQAYRCIRANIHNRDESILGACVHSGLKYQELTLPKEMTVWIDPYEVSCR
ncbi:protein BTG3-like [Mixophyes fleayi]|uniref:protein BTG3-like n=1 Tax=Mixophyes fleayi TaxID=3061075 RepID=UPI003F4DC9A1